MRDGRGAGRGRPGTGIRCRGRSRQPTLPDPAFARSGDLAPAPEAASSALDLSDARTEPSAPKQRAGALTARHRTNLTSIPASPTTLTLVSRTPSTPPGTPSAFGDAATGTSSPAKVLEIAAQPSSGPPDSVALAGVIFALVVAMSVVAVVSGYHKRAAALGPAERREQAHLHAARHRRSD